MLLRAEMASIIGKRRQNENEETEPKRQNLDQWIVLANLKNENGEVLVKEGVNLTLNTTTEKLQLICNALLKQVNMSKLDYSSKSN